jgi:hypothetical protein
MAKKRMRKYITDLLKERGPMDTDEVFNSYKKRYPTNACMNQLGAVLSRTKGVRKIGTRESTKNQSRVRCAIWEYQD